MMRLEKTEISKEKFYAAKTPIKIWDVNANNIVISKVEDKINKLMTFRIYDEKLLEKYKYTWTKI